MENEVTAFFNFADECLGEADGYLSEALNLLKEKDPSRIIDAMLLLHSAAERMQFGTNWARVGIREFLLDK